MGGMSLTGAGLRQDFTALGLYEGMVVLVHCSMRGIGRVDGGAVAVRDALLEVLGGSGTLVVPTQTRSKSTSSNEVRQSVRRLSPRRREQFLGTVPGFDPALTPSEGMGALAEAVRTHPRASRSAHPTASFAAIGAQAAELTASHPYDSVLGERSPLGWMHRAGAHVLLLGVGFDKCTAFHLGEDASVSRDRSYWFKVGADWTNVRGRNYDDSDFGALGELFGSTHADYVRTGFVGAAAGTLFPLALAADFAAKQLPALRDPVRDHAIHPALGADA
jgi:aminoglycoside 3-N-acetyltransferase